MMDILGVEIADGGVKPLKRIRTELYSFDKAFINHEGDIGFPVGKLVEVFGPTGVGKSTMCYGISGIIARILEGDEISLADFEDFDPRFLATILSTVGYSGKVYPIFEEEDEDTLDNLIINMKGNSVVGILDAIGSISPVSERTGELGEANMGRRAFLMAQFSRKALYALRSSKTYKSIFMINHQHQRIGGMSRGTIAPGGDTKGYLSSIRIQVKRRYRNNKEELFKDGSYVIEGKVVKNKWGLEDKVFHLFMLSGKGIHIGMNALYDAVELGLIKRDRTIKIGNKSYGYFNDIIEKAHAGDDEFFEPFINLLKEEYDDKRDNGDKDNEGEGD